MKTLMKIARLVMIVTILTFAGPPALDYSTGLWYGSYGRSDWYWAHTELIQSSTFARIGWNHGTYVFNAQVDGALNNE